MTGRVNGSWFFVSPWQTATCEPCACDSERSATARVNGQSFFGSPPASATGERMAAPTSPATAIRIWS